MKTKLLISKPLSTLFTTAFLGTSLLIGACSDNTTNDNATDQSTATENQSDATTDGTLAPTTSEPTVADTNSLVEDNQAADEIDITDDNINPVTNNEQPSLVTNATEAGTPEHTIKQALDTLYYGEAKDAIDYYKVDMANFEEELVNTQSAFQQTVDNVTLLDTDYNEDKTRATISGELMLKGQSEPAPLSYKLQKVDGKWKILG
ncbi:hypothetical protein [uncultured Psychrobacter sp.]|uniref:hypothetical protein n=1 Tax=uncultured Psychrobacter sp. TaxID=259303 RepID=UPI003459C704